MAKALKIFTIADENEREVLRKVCREISQEELLSSKMQTFFDDLLYTAQHSEEQGNIPAGGIAAPQVGRNLRVFYILNYDTNEWELFINPKLTPATFIKTSTQEGCLSVPDQEGEVHRYSTVRIKYKDRDGNSKTKRFRDLNAISIQHEMDHLDGILFIDKIDK